MLRRAGSLRWYVKAALLIALLSPATALAVYKPLRTVSPSIFAHVTCYADGICTDEPSRLAEARRVSASAKALAEGKVGAERSAPRITFCSTAACFARFSGAGAAALTLGTFGIVIAPRGWKPFVVAHELVHYRQAEELGNVRVWIAPTWMVEGMAYAMTDPRPELPEPLEDWRGQFLRWRAAHRGSDLWREVRGWL